MSIVDVIRSGNEPEQGLKPRSQITARELLREVGSVLRMSEAEAAKLGDIPVDPTEDQTMIINMGPQHPSTHGVLRLVLELKHVGRPVMLSLNMMDIARRRGVEIDTERLSRELGVPVVESVAVRRGGARKRRR